MRFWHGIGAVVALLGPGCQPAAVPPPETPGKPRLREQVSAPALARPASSASALPIAGDAFAEPALRSWIDTWLAAQNQADFARYQALYAERFEGIKRVGERVHRFDRAGWLADRARMFEPPKSGAAMRVDVSDLVVQSGGAAARVRFVQSYARGGFSDRGPKELFIVREGGALRIAREELLSSEIQSRAPAAKPAVGAFYFAIEQGVVLDDSPSAELAAGPLELMPPQGPIVVVRSALDEARLDPALALARSRPVLLNGLPECGARIGALWLVVRVDPHFGMRRAWSGQVEADGELKDTGQVASDETIAREVWELGSPMLVGELVDVPAGCHPVWVRDAALPAALSAQPRTAGSPELRAEAERQMLRFVARTAPPEAGLVPDLDVVQFGGKQPLLVGRYTHGSGCSDFSAATFVWRVKGPDTAPQLVLINDPERTPDFIPELAIDVDGDGRWELLGNQRSTLLEPAEAYGTGPAISVTFLDCPC
jgi:hypothetical protein